MTASVLSLCTGYGGLDLAVEAVIPGAHTRWVSDIDHDACAVQAVRFADAEQLGDLKLVDWSAFAGRVDILSAGYPCQPFSTAGRRKGTDDPRHLWPWVADAIRLVGPQLVVLENVAGHLALGYDVVLADLAEMGMSARWGVVRASDAGAPHRRERLFVVARYPNGSPANTHATTGASRRASGKPGGRVAADPDGRGQQGESKQHGGAEAGVDSVDWGHADRRRVEAAADTDSSRSQRTEPTGRCELPARRAAADADGTAGDTMGSASSAIHEPGTIQRSGRCSGVGGATDWGRFGPAIERWERHMGRAAPAPLVDGTRQLNARFVEWMMGLEPGWVTDIVPNRRALKVLGNGVVPQQAAMALGALL